MMEQVFSNENLCGLIISFCGIVVSGVKGVEWHRSV